MSKNQWLTMSMQLAIAMIVGVFYIGVGVLKFQQYVFKGITNENKRF